MTNWQYYLGTPALAAQFLAKVKAYGCDMGDSGCTYCPLADVDCDDWRDLKAWLESEME